MSVDWDDFDQALLRAGKRHAAPSNLQKRALAAATAAGVASLGALAAKAPVVAAGKVATAAALGKSVGLFSRLLALKWAFWATTATVGLASVAVVAVSRPSTADPKSALSVPAPIAKKAANGAKTLPNTREEAQAPASNVLAPETSAPAALVTPATAATPFAPATEVAEVVHSARVEPVEPVASGSHPAPAAKPFAARGPAPAAAVVAANEVPVATPKVDVVAGLSEEVHVLDAARAALRRGDSALALTRCDEHAARFKHGSFAIERDVVRVDALLAAGRKDEARVEARAFVVAHPNAPQAARLQKVGAQ